MAITKVSFEPLEWFNKVTKRSATNYNRMEKGIDDCANAVNSCIDAIRTAITGIGNVNTEYFEKINEATYRVINGFCTLRVEIRAKTNITNATIVISGLPEATQVQYFNVSAWLTDTNVAYGYIYEDSLWIIAGALNDEAYIFSITYPVV